MNRSSHSSKPLQVNESALLEQPPALSEAPRQKGASKERLQEELEHLQTKYVELQAVYRDQQENLQHQLQRLQRQRERLSNEIHDETAQYLTALSLNLKALVPYYTTESPGRQALERMQRSVEGLSNTVHQMSLRLRSGPLEYLAICPVLVAHLEEWSKQYQMDMTFESTGLMGVPLPPDLEIIIYRITQEALTNIIRHSQATSVRVELHAVDKEVRLLIEDNGRGFDVDSVFEATSRLGLRGMQERAKTVHGKLCINSALGQGTIITLRAPLEPPQ